MSKLVGRSTSRTPFKHWILNAELGRLVGIFGNPSARSKVPAKACPFLVVDLCAGDGVVSDDVNSSPSIITKHLQYAHARGVLVRCVLIEKSPYTYEKLVENVPRHDWIETLQMDSRDYVLQCKKSQAVFVHSDPNHIHDWPVTHEMLDSLSDTTTMLATLGCNVGGLKMLPKTEREKWYDHVRLCVEHMPKFHDAILISLDGDAAQWAYLLRLPVKWRSDTRNAILKTASRFVSFGISICSYRDERSKFNSLQDRLFLTSKERLSQ